MLKAGGKGWVAALPSRCVLLHRGSTVLFWLADHVAREWSQGTLDACFRVAIRSARAATMEVSTSAQVLLPPGLLEPVHGSHGFCLATSAFLGVLRDARFDARIAESSRLVSCLQMIESEGGDSSHEESLPSSVFVVPSAARTLCIASLDRPQWGCAIDLTRMAGVEDTERARSARLRNVKQWL